MQGEVQHHVAIPHAVQHCYNFYPRRVYDFSNQMN